MEYSLVLISVKKKEEALHIQEFLVKDRLASSVEMLDSTISFTDKFKFEKSVNHLLLARTKSSLLEKLSARSRDLSKTCEIFSVPLLTIDPESQKHIDQNTC